MIIKPPARTTDVHGQGHWHASRGKNRLHQGVDVACYAGSRICAIKGGEVTKHGWPYQPDDSTRGHLRYIQVTDTSGQDWRYFYVHPLVDVGDWIMPGQVLGISQGLQEIYKGITDHIHVEVKKEGVFIDPTRLVFS